MEKERQAALKTQNPRNKMVMSSHIFKPGLEEAGNPESQGHRPKENPNESLISLAEGPG